MLEGIAVLGRDYPEQPEIEALAEQRDEVESVQKVPLDDTGPTALNTLPGPSGGGLASRALKIVTVASEWQSGRGGISTLNRELCVALAVQGHNVYCAVVTATAEERDSARQSGVELVTCPRVIGMTGEELLLLLEPKSFGESPPDVVIGHDQITGPQALRLAGLLGRPYVHILHTIPEEIEPHKGRTQARRGGFFRGVSKREAQNDLCKEAALVVGIGPRIFGQIPPGRSAPTHEMIPGLNIELLKLQITRTSQSSCLLTGRMEDADLKGLGTAAQAIFRIRSERQSASDPAAPELVVRGLDGAYGEEELLSSGLDNRQRAGWLKPRPYSPKSEDIYDDIRKSTLVLMPSLSEGFGLTGYEAIAAGIPVLISEESGLADLMKSSETEGLIDSGFITACIVVADSNEQVAYGRWANQIRALHADIPKAFARAESVRTKMAAHYTWNRAAAKLVAELEALL